jgi:hypothetical protein
MIPQRIQRRTQKPALTDTLSFVLFVFFVVLKLCALCDFVVQSPDFAILSNRGILCEVPSLARIAGAKTNLL